MIILHFGKPKKIKRIPEKKIYFCFISICFSSYIITYTSFLMNILFIFAFMELNMDNVCLKTCFISLNYLRCIYIVVHD